MPELPDVETFRRYFDATSLAQTIEHVAAHSDQILEGTSPQALGRSLHGAQFDQTQRQGKHLFVQTNQQGWLGLHFGMTGRLRYYKGPQDEPEYTYLRIDFRNQYHLALIMPRKLGKVRFLDHPETLIQEKKLGPDALHLDQGDFIDLLHDRRGMVKSTLMNQQIIAGIGNVYSDEILYQLGWHPRTQLHALQREDLQALYHEMRAVLQLAIKKQADPARFPQDWITPEREPEAACPACGGSVARVKVSGRSAYFCPQCQSKPHKKG